MKTFPEVLTVRPILSAAGEVPMPGSKSISNRALLLAALSSGRTELKGILRADDTERMMESLRKLGVSVEIDEGNPESVTVEGCGGRFPVRSAELSSETPEQRHGRLLRRWRLPAAVTFWMALSGCGSVRSETFSWRSGR